jgi:Nickel/cobalt transporter regulator
MRALFFTLLIGGGLLPAAAHSEPGDRAIRSHGERFESSGDSSQDRPQRVQRAERSIGEAPRVHVDRAERPARAERSVEAHSNEPTRVRHFDRSDTAEPAQHVEQVRPIQRNDDGFVGAMKRIGRDETVRHQQDSVAVHRDHVGFGGLRDRIVRNGDRDDSHKRWSRDWRHDRRYNWYSYRNRYSSLYRLGSYYDPYGWNYRRFGIGYSLWPNYYGSNYWLNDPWQYRLPPAYGPYRWVRYYDDALLVNTFTGQVVDVVYNFFW